MTNLNNEFENILIFSFDEQNTEYDNTYYDKKLNNFIIKVEKQRPNIIFICTQNSISRTEKHLQHLIGNKLPEEYKRFSKVDATRHSNLKKIYYKNLRNVRTRIYYNQNTVCFNSFTFERFKNQSYKKRSIFNFSNNSNNTDFNSYRHINDNGKIHILNYKYRRHTVEGHNGRIGKGGIMTCITLGKNYRSCKYIVCNFVGLNKNIINKIYNKNKNIEKNIIYNNTNIFNLKYNNKPKAQYNKNRYSITNTDSTTSTDILNNNNSNNNFNNNSIIQSDKNRYSIASTGNTDRIHNNNNLDKIFLYFISTNGLEKFKTTSKKNKNKNKNQYFIN
jgi:hypothetical protein